MSALFAKPKLGQLVVQVDYKSTYNYSLMVSVRALKIREPITWEGKVFEVPAGTYTVSLKGLLADPNHQGSYHQAYQDAYGSFERSQRVHVAPGGQTLCRFEVPGDRLPVTIQVVQGEEQVDGAEVLIKSVDPNFHVTKRQEGAQFFLEPGTYPVVISHRNALVKEVIVVNASATEFTIDLGQQSLVRPVPVVARYRDGRLVKGTTEDFAPNASEFRVVPVTGGPILVKDLPDLKAVFFVKDLDGNRLYDERKDFAVAEQFGRKTVVNFYDKEELWGYTLAGHTQQPYFFLFPVDPESNNAKVYVVRASTTVVRYA